MMQNIVFPLEIATEEINKNTSVQYTLSQLTRSMEELFRFFKCWDYKKVKCGGCKQASFS